MVEDEGQNDDGQRTLGEEPVKSETNEVEDNVKEDSNEVDNEKDSENGADNGNNVEIEVTYEVFEIEFKEPVLGIAIHSIDNQYICGLNTLLDNVEIPWKQGINKFRLTYRNINLTGGSYHFDVALFEKNASVSFDYKAKYKTFIVDAPYIGEGICILNHEWNEI